MTTLGWARGVPAGKPGPRRDSTALAAAGCAASGRARRTGSPAARDSLENSALPTPKKYAEAAAHLSGSRDPVRSCAGPSLLAQVATLITHVAAE